ncbi:hypothetical protein MBLNU13_g00891t1 [Cladosporium sp. NU13]
MRNAALSYGAGGEAFTGLIFELGKRAFNGYTARVEEMEVRMFRSRISTFYHCNTSNDPSIPLYINSPPTVAARHKLECKVAIHRRQLSRNGSLVQEVLYQISKAIWSHDVSRVKKIEHVERDGDPRLLVWRGERQDGVDLTAFSHDLIKEERNERTTLALLSSTSADPFTDPLVGDLVETAKCHITVEAVGVHPLCIAGHKFKCKEPQWKSLASSEGAVGNSRSADFSSYPRKRQQRRDSTMSFECSESQKAALPGEQTQQNDTQNMEKAESKVRGTLKSIKLCASDVARWTQHHTRKLLDGQYNSAMARVFDRQEYLDAAEMQPEPGSAEYLMLAFSGRNDVDKLHQVRLADLYPASDAEFFKLLRKEYYTNRKRYYGRNPWWREVRKIFFVKFVTRHLTPTQHSIQIIATESVPGVYVAGWTRTVGPIDPPSSSFVTRLFQAPEAARPGSVTFLEIPRKLSTGILDTGEQTGWGLYLLEGTRWTLVYSLLLLWVLIGRQRRRGSGHDCGSSDDSTLRNAVTRNMREEQRRQAAATKKDHLVQLAGVIEIEDLGCEAQKFALAKMEEAISQWAVAQSTSPEKVLRLPVASFMHAFCTFVWPIELMERELRVYMVLMMVASLRKSAREATSGPGNDA